MGGVMGRAVMERVMGRVMWEDGDFPMRVTLPHMYACTPTPTSTHTHTHTHADPHPHWFWFWW